MISTSPQEYELLDVKSLEIKSVTLRSHNIRSGFLLKKYRTFDDMTFAVNAHGGKDGVYYKYIIKGGGLKICITNRSYTKKQLD